MEDSSKVEFISLEVELLDARNQSFRRLPFVNRQEMRPHDTWEFKTNVNPMGWRSARVQNLVVR
jgi:hypothetical protein